MQARIRILKSLFALCVPFLYVGCTSDYSEEVGSKTRLELGNVSYLIPSDYLLADLPMSMVAINELDTGSGVVLKIPLTDLELNPDTTIDADSDIVVLISESNDMSRKPSVLPGGLAAWNGTGLFKERIIEFDNKVDLFRIYPASGYPVFWEFFRASPLSGGKAESEWVAGCWSSGSSGALHNASCDLLITYVGVLARVSLSGKYVKNADEIKLSFVGMLAGWSR